MYTYWCIYIYLCIYIHTCIYVDMYVYIYIHLHVRLTGAKWSGKDARFDDALWHRPCHGRRRVNRKGNAWKTAPLLRRNRGACNVSMYVCMYVCMYVYYTHTHTHTYTCACTCTYTFIHIHIHDSILYTLVPMILYRMVPICSYSNPRDISGIFVIYIYI